MITTWGYELTALEVLPDLLTVDQYATLTGRADDANRVEEEIAAACVAVRNYVGWHLGPSAACRMSTVMSDRRITRVGCDLLIQLPARFVTGVTSVSIDGAAQEHFAVDSNGILRVFDVGCVARYSAVVVDYTAGLSDAMLASIRDLVAHRVMHAHAVAPGITSEASGGVSVTYNAGWVNNAQSSTLNNAERELLVPYKVQGVF